MSDHRLDRLFKPRSVAIVGASDNQMRSVSVTEAIRDTDIQLFLVNPNRPIVHGESAYPSLSDIGQPIDAVLSLVGPEATVAQIAEAKAAGCGGMVAIANGFGESGPEGAALEKRLAAVAGDFPVLGPNCNGFINRISGARLTGAPRLPLRAGGVGLVTHSGGMFTAIGIAAAERNVGFSQLISTGNEAVLDMADCIDFLTVDPETRSVCLIVESIRRPEKFFAAVSRALDAGKPIVAMKLGRSSRGREIATSHTGAVAGDAWTCDTALRQHGVAVASDLLDLTDRLLCFEHLAPARWRKVGGVAIASLSGGWAALASDIFEAEGVDLPALDAYRATLEPIIPGVSVVNPLDLTGRVMSRPDLAEAAFDALLAAPQVDALLVPWFLGDEAVKPGSAVIEPLRKVAARSDKILILGTLDDGRMGDWALNLPREGIMAGRGLRATARALRTMTDFCARRERATGPAPSPLPQPLPRPSRWVDTEAGPILPFEDAMAFLERFGIPTAPFAIIGDGALQPDTVAGMTGPYVVKLADVPHRTELGAVRVSVPLADLAGAVAEMQSIAARHKVPGKVVIQPFLPFSGEAFAGARIDTGLGPMVVCGIGGIFVEVLKAVAGRLAPLDGDDAAEMLSELNRSGLLDGHRGARPWDREGLTKILLGLSDLALSTRSWLDSIDINPLGLTDQGFVAVDALFIAAKDNGGETRR